MRLWLYATLCRGNDPSRVATRAGARQRRSRSATNGRARRRPHRLGSRTRRPAPNRRSASTALRAALIAAAHERPQRHVSLCTSAALCEPHCSSVTGRRRSRQRRSSATSSFSGTSLRASERRIGTSRARCRSTYFRASEARGRQIVVEIERRTRVCVSFWQCTRISHSAGMGIGGSLASCQGVSRRPWAGAKGACPVRSHGAGPHMGERARSGQVSYSAEAGVKGHVRAAT